MKVCFVSLALYPCLAGDFSSGHIGGAEVQQAQIAKALVAHGVEVTAICLDYGQPDADVCCGVTVYKAYRPGDGLPVLRFVYPNLVSIYKALARADADVYYVRNASFLTAVVNHYCRRNGRRWVFAGAHDTDFMPGRELISNWRDRWLYRRGIVHADRVVVQSGAQAELLRQNYALEATVIRNFIDGGALDPDNDGRPLVLWVATLREWKRPELLLEIARQLPEYEFVMIGGADASNRGLYGKVAESAGSLPNLRFLGFRGFAETESWFDRATVFVNTSEHEGFPNTFLQAWRRGVPVVTFFDPDRLVETHGLGRRVDSVTGAVEAIRSLATMTCERARMIQDYFTENHSGRVLDQYVSLFTSLCNEK